MQRGKSVDATKYPVLRGLPIAVLLDRHGKPCGIVHLHAYIILYKVEWFIPKKIERPEAEADTESGEGGLE